jgi:hypothetical protein
MLVPVCRRSVFHFTDSDDNETDDDDVRDATYLPDSPASPYGALVEPATDDTTFSLPVPVPVADPVALGSQPAVRRVTNAGMARRRTSTRRIQKPCPMPACPARTTDLRKHMRNCHKQLTNADITAYVKDQARACRRPNRQPVGPEPAIVTDDDVNASATTSTTTSTTPVSQRVMSLQLSQTRCIYRITAHLSGQRVTLHHGFYAHV